MLERTQPPRTSQLLVSELAYILEDREPSLGRRAAVLLAIEQFKAKTVSKEDFAKVYEIVKRELEQGRAR